MSNFWGNFFDIGGLAGFFSFIYLVAQGIRKKPKIKFPVSGYSGKSVKKNKQEYYELKISGTLKNQSSDSNVISKVHLIVWRDRKRNSSFRFGGFSGEIINRSTNERMVTPIELIPKQSLDLQFLSDVLITGTADQSALSEIVKSDHMKKYELVFEDTNENLFDQRGKLFNREECNLRWCLSNSVRLMEQGKHLPYILERIKILKSRVKFKFKILFYSIGLFQ